MNKYHLISLPRSGQHLTERLLEAICKYFNKPYSYCEFYTCCQEVPCKKNSIFMKNHDFGLTHSKNSDEKYIVLYRTDLVQQFDSWFKLLLKPEKRNVYFNQPLLYNYFLFFTKKHLPYRNSFLNKWVKQNENYKQSENKNIIAIYYDELVKNPLNYLKKLLDFMEIKYEENDPIKILSNFEEIKYLNRLSLELHKKILSDINKLPDYVPDYVPTNVPNYVPNYVPNNLPRDISTSRQYLQNNILSNKSRDISKNKNKRWKLF